jgi:hypothetical protein
MTQFVNIRMPQPLDLADSKMQSWLESVQLMTTQERDTKLHTYTEIGRVP